MTKTTPILIYPQKVLRQKAVAIDKIDKTHEDIFATMLTTLQEADGIGLAAPQIGVGLRMIIINIPETEERGKEFYKMINPEIIDHAEEKEQNVEGCLSLPGLSLEVPRYQHVSVTYTDLDGKTHSISQAGGLLGRCIQHEIDHLDGTLILDRVSRLRRMRALSSWQKLMRDNIEN